MDGLTLQIFNWLTELDELESARFISNCIVENFYKDTFLDKKSDKITDMFDVTVFVPLKTYKNLSGYSLITTKIEEAIRESAAADSLYIDRIDWKARLKSESELQSDKRGEIITELLTQDYVSKQVRLMNQSINNNPHLALGAAKELIETCCKSILVDKGVIYDKEWKIQRLIKETNENINLISSKMGEDRTVKSAISLILGGLSNVVHGVAELRNVYGTGHGHDPDFEMLDNLYVKLAVASASELAIFYLAIHTNESNKPVIK